MQRKQLTIKEGFDLRNLKHEYEMLLEKKLRMELIIPKREMENIRPNFEYQTIKTRLIQVDDLRTQIYLNANTALDMVMGMR